MSDAVQTIASCAHLQNTSPENPSCAWCDLYRINIDRSGRLCGKCRDDDKFRQGLELLRQARTAPASKPVCNGSENDWCDRFACVTTSEQCERCKSDPEFRQFLFSQFMTKPKKKPTESLCPHRGEKVGTVIKKCCGGREKEVVLYICKIKGKADEIDCQRCRL